MNQFFLKFSIPKSPITIQHGDGILLVGSCFSDEISKKIKFSGHTVSSNPHGTIFHPSVIAYNLMDAFNEEMDQRIFKRENQFFTWNASTLISADSEENLKHKLLEIKKELKQKLIDAKLLIVTFGTAWGYELNETNELVANCHKMPSQLFTKFLSSPYEIVQDWILAIEKIKEFNPDIQIVFTASPVRHIKDGLVENNLSKSRLIEAIQQLCLEENTAYFPSYELIIDVLRDYRFFKEDQIHPTEEAINFVWKKFEETYFDQKTIDLNGLVEKVNRLNQHIPINNLEEHQRLIKDKQNEISLKNGSIAWF